MHYDNFLVYTTFLSSLPLFLKNSSLKLREFCVTICFFSVIGLGLLYNVAFPYQEGVVTYDWETYVRRTGNPISYLDSSSPKIGYYLMFICIVFIILIAKKNFTKNDWITLLHRLISINKVSIILGTIEFVFANLFKSRIITDIFIKIFGEFGVQQNWLVSRGGLFTIQGATKEASMYTTVIFYIAVLLLVEMSFSKKHKKTDCIWLIASVVLLLLNPALSSVIYLLSLAIIFYTLEIINLKKGKKRRYENTTTKKGLIYIALSSVILLALLYNYSEVLASSNNYIIRRIGFAFKQLEIIWNYGVSYTISSEAIRFTGIITDIKLLLNRPLLGFGLGALTCNSGVVTLLIGVGIVGFAAWYAIYFMLCFEKKNVKHIVLFWGVMIIPNIIQNELLTIMCMVIPICCILIEIGEKETMHESNKCYLKYCH